MGLHLIALHQPGYLKNISYYLKIAFSQSFVSLDVVQYAKNEWQNRQYVVINNKKYWLTVPLSKDKQLIKDKLILNGKFLKSHITYLRHAFGGFPYFSFYLEDILSFYQSKFCYLNNFCEILNFYILERLGIDKNYCRASSLLNIETALEKQKKGSLIATILDLIVQQTGYSHVNYLSGFMLSKHHYLFKYNNLGFNRNDVLLERGYENYMLFTENIFNFNMTGFEFLFTYGPEAVLVFNYLKSTIHVRKSY